MLFYYSPHQTVKYFQNFIHNKWTKIAIIKVGTVLSTVTVLTFMLNMRTSCLRINNCFLPHRSTFYLIYVTTQKLFKLYITLDQIKFFEFEGRVCFKTIGANSTKFCRFPQRSNKRDILIGIKSFYFLKHKSVQILKTATGQFKILCLNRVWKNLVITVLS